MLFGWFGAVEGKEGRRWVMDGGLWGLGCRPM